MGKISQADAATAARKICEPINTKGAEIETKLKEYITEIWKEGIPANVMKMFNSDSEYIKTVGSVNISGQGMSKSRSVSLVGAWPSRTSQWSSTEFPLTNPQAQKAVKLIDAKSAMDKKYKDTKDEVEQTLLNLGTHKRVLEQFPEAYGHLPGVNTNTQLVTQLQPVRDKVRCLVSEDKEKKCIDKI